MEYSDIVRFHGHECPGLAIGYRMSLAALETLHEARAADEELVAIVENNACGVDAVQFLTGCTFGKGNLLFRDYGKQVYTFYSRPSRHGVRVVYHGRGIPDEVRESRHELAKFILSSSADSLLSVSPVIVAEPEPARVRISLPCARCGEAVMETRVRKREGECFCIPCDDDPGRAAEEKG